MNGKKRSTLPEIGNSLFNADLFQVLFDPTVTDRLPIAAYDINIYSSRPVSYDSRIHRYSVAGTVVGSFWPINPDCTGSR